MMTTFDKVAAVLTIPIGLVFLVLGGLGLFVGSNANFSLPPVLGGLPILMGWSMSVTLIRYWRKSSQTTEEDQPSQMFLRFLGEHPELQGEPKEAQWRGFHRWLDEAQP